MEDSKYLHDPHGRSLCGQPNMLVVCIFSESKKMRLLYNFFFHTSRWMKRGMLVFYDLLIERSFFFFCWDENKNYRSSSFELKDFQMLGCSRTEDHGHIIPLKFEKNWVLNVHDPYGGSWTHNPLKIREKWGTTCRRSSSVRAHPKRSVLARGCKAMLGCSQTLDGRSSTHLLELYPIIFDKKKNYRNT